MNSDDQENSEPGRTERRNSHIFRSGAEKYPNIIKVYKGGNFDTHIRKKMPNVIVFDLDETLGSYSDLYILWKHLQTYTSFNELLELFPEFARYKMVSILEYIYKKKINGKCEKIFIYTNNQCSYDFVDLISNYFCHKLGIDNGELFDQIIRAFKVGDKYIEILRTTQQKTYTDFIRCTLLPPNTQIFFVDNSYFPEMESKRIYYIQPLSYHHHLSKEVIINRLMIWNSQIFFRSPFSLLSNVERANISLIYEELTTFPQTFLNKNNDYIEMKKRMDMFVAKKIMYYIKEFFHLTRLAKNTKKRAQLSSKYTRKFRKSTNP